jgi:predicted DNA-binding transcriptional regulator AlpA
MPADPLHDAPPNGPACPTGDANGHMADSPASEAPEAAGGQLAQALAGVLDLLAQQQKFLQLACGLLANAQKNPLLARLAVDADDLAGIMNLGVRTIRTLDSAGGLPRPVKLGSRRLWNVQELRSWMSAGCPDRTTWEKLRQERRQQRARKRR